MTFTPKFPWAGLSTVTLGSWTLGPGQLQVQVAGQVVIGEVIVGLVTVMIPLPGKLLSIS